MLTLSSPTQTHALRMSVLSPHLLVLDWHHKKELQDGGKLRVPGLGVSLGARTSPAPGDAAAAPQSSAAPRGSG